MSRAGLDLAWGAATDTGKIRKVNEDSFLELPGVFVVADGMGGHQAGDVASRLTVEAVTEVIGDDLPDISVLGELVRRANESVRSHANTVGREGMGSTLVGALLVRNGDEESIVVVNVGDSRCYALVDGTLAQITKDHSQVQELVDAGEITPEQATTHPERNVVTRAIGIDDTVAGDFFVLPSLAHSRLLLCSDGVSGELTHDHMTELLATLDDPQEAADALVAAVLQGRAGDNATVVVVDVVRDIAPLEDEDSDADVTGPRPRRASTVELDDTVEHDHLKELIADVPGDRPDADQVAPAPTDHMLISDVPG